MYAFILLWKCCIFWELVWIPVLGIERLNFSPIYYNWKVLSKLFGHVTWCWFLLNPLTCLPTKIYY